MDKSQEESHYNFKGFFKYISTVVSWTVFVLLVLIGICLIYYYISLKLYATKGEKYEPAFSVYTIVSQSMEPTISVYDVIINTKVNNIDDIEINDVITFISTWQVTYGMTITHRVVGTKILDDGSKCFITRGDNNTQDDQACVKESNVIGVVKAVVPGLGKLQFFLSSGIGWLLVIIIPALYIIIKDIIKIIKMAKNKSTEKAKVKKKANEKIDKYDININENMDKIDKMVRQREIENEKEDTEEIKIKEETGELFYLKEDDEE